MEFNAFNVSEISWREIAKDVKDKNETLFNAMQSSAFEKDLTFIKARYPYGAKIIENGILHLPHRSGISVPITSSEVNEKLVKKLCYSKIPLGFLSNKASEIYIERHGRVMPLKLLYPGDLFGLFETVDAMCGIDGKPKWCVSSGARNLFMLPKIADKTSYRRLQKEFNLEIQPPRNLADHWQIFVALSNHVKHIEEWFKSHPAASKRYPKEVIEGFKNKKWIASHSGGIYKNLDKLKTYAEEENTHPSKLTF